MGVKDVSEMRLKLDLLMFCGFSELGLYKQ